MKNMMFSLVLAVLAAGCIPMGSYDPNTGRVSTYGVDPAASIGASASVGYARAAQIGATADLVGAQMQGQAMLERIRQTGEVLHSLTTCMERERVDLGSCTGESYPGEAVAILSVLSQQPGSYGTVGSFYGAMPPPAAWSAYTAQPVSYSSAPTATASGGVVVDQHARDAVRDLAGVFDAYMQEHGGAR